MGMQLALRGLGCLTCSYRDREPQTLSLCCGHLLRWFPPDTAVSGALRLPHESTRDRAFEATWPALLLRWGLAFYLTLNIKGREKGKQLENKASRSGTEISNMPGSQDLTLSQASITVKFQQWQCAGCLCCFPSELSKLQAQEITASVCARARCVCTLLSGILLHRARCAQLQLPLQERGMGTPHSLPGLHRCAAESSRPSSCTGPAPAAPGKGTA